MLIKQILADFEALLEAAPKHIAKARIIETSDHDDEFVRIAVSGFLENATVDDWGRESYSFVMEARNGEFRDEVLLEHYESDGRAMGLFQCLAMGYNLGLFVAQRISKEQFTACELAVYAFCDMNYRKIVDAFCSRDNL